MSVFGVHVLVCQRVSATVCAGVNVSVSVSVSVCQCVSVSVLTLVCTFVCQRINVGGSSLMH